METFPIRIGRRSAPFLRLWGVRPDEAVVTLSGEALDARFGAFRVRTPLSNIKGWRIEGPFRWITAIGVRMSIRHRDVSFWGGAPGGVRLDFRERVPFGPFKVPALYVGADDLEGLAAELKRRGIPGTDARRT